MMKALENPALDLDLRKDIADVALATTNARIEYLLQCRLLDRGVSDAYAVVNAMQDWNEKKALLDDLMDEAIYALMRKAMVY